MSEAPRRRIRLAIGLVFAASVAVRVAASGRELWLDETHSALLAGMSLGELIEFVKGDVHPPLYFLLLNAWRRVAGESEAALRGFSILASAGAGAVFLAAAIRVLGLTWPAVLAGALYLLSPVLVYYGVEVRMYALASLWTALVLLGIPRLYSDSARGSGATLVTAGAVLGFYTHYAVLFVLAGLLGFGVHEALRRRLPARPVLAAALATAILCAPWAPVLGEQQAAKAELRRAETAARADPESLSYRTDANPDRPFRESVRTLVENGASIAGVFPAGSPVLLAGLALPLLFLAAAAAARAARLRYARLFLWVAGALLAAGLGTGITARRFLLLVVPFLAIGLAEAALDLWRRRPRLALVLGGSVAAVYLGGAVRVASQPTDRSTEALVRYVAANLRPGDLVVTETLYHEILLGYHARRLGTTLSMAGFPVGIREWWAAQAFKGWGGPAIGRSTLREFVESLPARTPSGRIWLTQFETRYYDPERRLLRALSERGRVTPAPSNRESSGQELFLIELSAARP